MQLLKVSNKRNYECYVPSGVVTGVAVELRNGEGHCDAFGFNVYSTCIPPKWCKTGTRSEL